MLSESEGESVGGFEGSGVAGGVAGGCVGVGSDDYCRKDWVLVGWHQRNGLERGRYVELYCGIDSAGVDRLGLDGNVYAVGGTGERDAGGEVGGLAGNS